MRKNARTIGRLGIVASIILGMGAMLLSGSHFALAQGAARVDIVMVNGFIDFLIAQYLARGIQIAEQEGAQCLVVQLDTPGGSDGAMRAIVQSILNASVPVVVYVSPAEARAGSNDAAAYARALAEKASE